MHKVSLSKLANITMGTSLAGEFCGIHIDGIPLLNGPAEFTDFCPKPVQFTSNAKRFSKTGDILFCVRGSTTGRMNWSDQKYAIGRGLAALSHKYGSEYNHFLRYLLETNLSSLLNNTNGSTFPNLTSDLLANFRLTVPELDDQKKISTFVRAIDKKIELNNRINAELEAMAKTLYDYWFVQFDFPISKEQVGKNGIYYFDEPLGFGAFCSKIVPEKGARSFVNTFLQTTWFRAYIKNQCLGTNINNLTGDHINKCPIALPTKGLLGIFEEVTGDIYQRISVNTIENQKLADLRDWLLPMLMNGQVKVTSSPQPTAKGA